MHGKVNKGKETKGNLIFIVTFEEQVKGHKQVPAEAGDTGYNLYD